LQLGHREGRQSRIHINFKTARALSIIIPPLPLGHADADIE